MTATSPGLAKHKEGNHHEPDLWRHKMHEVKNSFCGVSGLVVW